MNIYSTLKNILLAAAIISASAVGSITASAQAFLVEPARPNILEPRSENWFIYDAQPGQVIEDVVKIENDSLDDMTVFVSSNDLTPTDSGSFAVAPSDYDDVEVGSWTQINEANYFVGARDFIEIPFTIQIPDDAEPGEYAGGITAYPIQDSLSTIDVTIRQGARIYINVGSVGDLEYSAEIVDFSIVNITDEDYVDSLPIAKSIGKDVMAIEYTVDYSGQVFSNLFGTLEIEFPDGSAVQKRVSAELIPRQGPVTRYVIITEPYQVGAISARMVYSVEPLTAQTGQEDSGVVTSSLELSDEDLNGVNAAEIKTFNEPTTPGVSTEDSRNRLNWIAAVVGVLAIIGVGVFVLVMFRNRSKE